MTRGNMVLAEYGSVEKKKIEDEEVKTEKFDKKGQWFNDKKNIKSCVCVCVRRISEHTEKELEDA